MDREQNKKTLAVLRNCLRITESCYRASQSLCDIYDTATRRLTNSIKQLEREAENEKVRISKNREA